jgi:ferritin-like metal-binding protein YciE
LESTVAEKTLKDAFYETLKDVYYAEKAGLRSLKTAAKAAHSPELKAALTEHGEQSQGQVERLKQVFEVLGKAPRSKTCEAMQGLTSEMEEDLEDFGDSPAGDDVLIGCAQAVEHYEIARYGMLRSWAKKLGLAEAESLLAETLEEERQSDQRLTEIAESLAATGEDEEPEEDEEDEAEEPAESAPKSRAKKR